MFIYIILVIICISFLLSIGALRTELRKNKKTEQVATELAKGRVVFHAPTVSDMPQNNTEHMSTHTIQPETTIEQQITAVHDLPDQLQIPQAEEMNKEK